MDINVTNRQLTKLAPNKTAEHTVYDFNCRAANSGKEEDLVLYGRIAMNEHNRDFANIMRAKYDRTIETITTRLKGKAQASKMNEKLAKIYVQIVKEVFPKAVIVDWNLRDDDDNTIPYDPHLCEHVLKTMLTDYQLQEMFIFFADYHNFKEYVADNPGAFEGEQAGNESGSLSTGS